MARWNVQPQGHRQPKLRRFSPDTGGRAVAHESTLNPKLGSSTIWYLRGPPLPTLLYSIRGLFAENRRTHDGALSPGLGLGYVNAEFILGPYVFSCYTYFLRFWKKDGTRSTTLRAQARKQQIARAQSTCIATYLGPIS